MDKFKESDINDEFHSNTTLHPCSIETLKSNIFCCGSYELDESTGHRKGQLDVFHDNCEIINTFSMESGILDMKVMSNMSDLNESSRLVTAESSGSISIYDLTTAALKVISSTESEHGLTLSVDCCSCSLSHEDSVFVSSYQDSAIVVHRLTPTGLGSNQIHCS